MASTLDKDNNGAQKELLKQVLGNNRPIYLQSEYSGQYNLSSSLHFKRIGQRLEDSRADNENLAVIDQYNQTLKDYLSKVLSSDSEGDRANRNRDTLMRSINNKRTPYKSFIPGGGDNLPGKTFTESQHYFKHNIVGRDKFSGVKKRQTRKKIRSKANQKADKRDITQDKENLKS